MSRLWVAHQQQRKHSRLLSDLVLVVLLLLLPLRMVVLAAAVVARGTEACVAIEWVHDVDLITAAVAVVTAAIVTDVVVESVAYDWITTQRIRLFLVDYHIAQ